MSNVPNTSKDSFDYSKFFELVLLQQGVPVLDSDWNEQAAILNMKNMMDMRAMMGSLALVPVDPVSNSQGFKCVTMAAVADDVDITAGYACVEGSVVSSTRTATPAATTYKSDANYMTEGTVSGISGGDTIEDEFKKYTAEWDLVDCIIKMTSGTEAGNEFVITAIPTESSLQVTAIATISIGDTYIIKPPALPAVVVVPTTLYLQVWVWWEYVNSDQDPSIINAGVAIETCERLVKRWCVRADAVTAPTPSYWTYSMRKANIATLNISPGHSELAPELDLKIFANPGAAWNRVFTEVKLITASGATEAQLSATDNQYYLGKSTTADEMKSFFQLLSDSDAENLMPLMGSDQGEIKVGSIWRTSNTVEITNPSTVVDSNGFIHEDIWIRYDLTDTIDASVAGNLTVKCAVRANLNSLDQDTPDGELQAAVTRSLHSNNVRPKSYSSESTVLGQTETIPVDALQGALEQITDSLRDRPKSVMSDVNAYWKLLQSTDSGTDASMTNTYWRGFELVTINGGSLVAGSQTTYDIECDNIEMTVDGYIDDSTGDKVRVHAHVEGATVSNFYDLRDEADWDYYEISDPADSGAKKIYGDINLAGTIDASWIDAIQGIIGILTVTDSYHTDKTYRSSGHDIVDAGFAGANTFTLLWAMPNSGGHLKLYLYNSGSPVEKLVLVSHCYWDSGTAKWVYDGTDATGYPAYALSISPGEGIIFYYHPNTPTSWTHAQWLAESKMYTNMTFSFSGAHNKHIYYSFEMNNTSGAPAHLSQVKLYEWPGYIAGQSDVGVLYSEQSIAENANTSIDMVPSETSEMVLSLGCGNLTVPAGETAYSRGKFSITTP